MPARSRAGIGSSPVTAQAVPIRRARHFPGGRAGIIIAVVGLLVILMSLRGIAGFYTDYLWYSAVGLTSVWSGVLGAKLGLAAVFSAVFFLACWGSLTVADHFAPRLADMGPEDELVQRYRRFAGRRPLLVRTAASVVLGILAGSGASGEWNNWLLFGHSVSFGVKDPQFHKDISFFVFKLPFLTFLVSWTFIALVVITIVTVVAHYLNGGIRVQGTGSRVAPQVKAHISLLLALIAVVKAAGYYLQRYDLDFSTRGYREGAFYTDIHAQLPALTLLIFISLVSFIILISNIRRRGWVLPVIGIGLWALVSIIVGAIYPAIVQTFTVQPAQLSKELPYIKRNIAATRFAMGLTHTKVTSFSDTSNLTTSEVEKHLSTLQDIRLWDPQFAANTIAKLQDIRSYYQFNQLAVDRYDIGGQLTPAIVGLRQLNTGGLPASSWQNDHLQYTHGYGVVLSPANQATGDGNPVFTIGDVPPVSTAGAPVIKSPSVYYGKSVSGYVVVDTDQTEMNYQNPATGQTVEGHYAGTGGVPIGSLITKAAFALRFGDINLLISPLITNRSRIMFVRDIESRVEKAAPFLRYDSDPYPVIAGGRLYYVQDAYTTTNNYPYGQEAVTSALPGSSGLDTNFNYVRNSVKVVIDAYNGTMSFYVVDPRDPIIRAYEAAFPRLFRSGSAMPAAIRQELRYPEDMFTVQAAMYGRYHITDASGFYNASDAWDLSQDPGTGALVSGSSGGNGGGGNGGGSLGPLGQLQAPSQSKRMAPIYQVGQLPGDSGLSFNILEPYVSVSQGDTQQILTGFLAARSDAANFGDGQLEAYVTPRGEQLSGPALINSQIQENTAISEQISLLDQHGSSVLFGSVMLVPIHDSLLYVRPLYVESSQNPLPQLQRVIVVYGNESAMAPTLAGALQGILGAPVPGLGSGAPQPAASTPSAGGRATGVSPQVASLLQQADADLAQAQADLRQGDLGGYQSEVTKAQSLIGQADKLAGGGAAGGDAASGGSGSSPGSTTTTTAAA